MTVEKLLAVNIPGEIGARISEEDQEKLSMCAYDVLMKRPRALTQLLVMEMVVLRRAIELAMTTRNVILANLSPAVVQVAMKD